MAHKAQSYYIKALKDGKMALVLYDNVEPTAAEQKMIDKFLSSGYTLMFETKKPSKSVEEMREELKADPEAAAEFEAYYKKEKKMFDKDGKELQAFFAACKVYQTFKKKNKKKTEKK